MTAISSSIAFHTVAEASGHCSNSFVDWALCCWGQHLWWCPLGERSHKEVGNGKLPVPLRGVWADESRKESKAICKQPQPRQMKWLDIFNCLINWVFLSSFKRNSFAADDMGTLAVVCSLLPVLHHSCGCEVSLTSQASNLPYNLESLIRVLDLAFYVFARKFQTFLNTLHTAP